MQSVVHALFQKNLSFLKRNYPQLFHTISRSQNDIQIDILPYGNDFHVVYNNRVLKSIDALSQKRISTLIDEIAIFNFLPNYEDALYKQIPSLPKDIAPKSSLLKRSDVLVVFGLAPYFHIEKMIEIGVKKIILCEPELGSFLIFLHLFDLEGFLSNARKRGVELEFLTASGEEMWKTVLSRIYLPILSGALVLSYHSLETEELKALKDQIATYFKSIELTSGKEYFLRECRNFLCNMKKRDLYLKARDVLDDLPCLVVGSGPSLEKSLPMLREIQDRVIIISLTSTFKILYENGIKPDYLMILDPAISRESVAVLESAYDGLKEVVAIGTIGVDCDILSECQRSIIGHFSIFSSLFEEQPLRHRFGLYTVLDLTLNVLFESGATTIGLVGVDLGTKDLERLHANGYALADYFYNSTLYECEGNFGGKVFSPKDFHATKEIVEKMVRFYSHSKDLKLYNFSDGVKIEGFKPAKLEELKKFICNKEQFYLQFQTLFTKELPKMKNVEWTGTKRSIKEIVQSINTANSTKFQRGVKKLCTNISFFGNLHNIYYLRLLAKINMLLQLSSHPKKEFEKVVAQFKKDLQMEMELFYQLIDQIEKLMVKEDI